MVRFIERQELCGSAQLHIAQSQLADWKAAHPTFRHLDTTRLGEVIGNGYTTVEIVKTPYGYALLATTTS